MSEVPLDELDDPEAVTASQAVGEALNGGGLTGALKPIAPGVYKLDMTGVEDAGLGTDLLANRITKTEERLRASEGDQDGEGEVDLDQAIKDLGL